MVSLKKQLAETIIEKKVDGRSNPSAEKLEKLKLARERAYAIRAEQRELKDKELLVKQLEKEKREKEVNLKLKELGVTKEVPVMEIPAPEKPKIRKVKKIIIESDSGSSDDEPEVVYRKIKRTQSIPIPQEKPLITEDNLSQSHINNEMKRLRREMARKSLFKAF